MNPLTILRVEIIKRPIFNLLLLLLAIFGGNLGIAIIVLTLVIRLLLIKNAAAAMKMQGQMTDMQPKMQEIQEKHKDDPQKMSQEMMSYLKKSGGGPLK
jgi:YidC/Oxa1 family membrane protein insertase